MLWPYDDRSHSNAQKQPLRREQRKTVSFNTAIIAAFLGHGEKTTSVMITAKRRILNFAPNIRKETQFEQVSAIGTMIHFQQQILSKFAVLERWTDVTN